MNSKVTWLAVRWCQLSKRRCIIVERSGIAIKFWVVNCPLDAIMWNCFFPRMTLNWRVIPLTVYSMAIRRYRKQVFVSTVDFRLTFKFSFFDMTLSGDGIKKLVEIEASKIKLESRFCYLFHRQAWMAEYYDWSKGIGRKELR